MHIISSIKTGLKQGSCDFLHYYACFSIKVEKIIVFLSLAEMVVIHNILASKKSPFWKEQPSKTLSVSHQPYFCFHWSQKQFTICDVFLFYCIKSNAIFEKSSLKSNYSTYYYVHNVLNFISLLISLSYAVTPKHIPILYAVWTWILPLKSIRIFA